MQQQQQLPQYQFSPVLERKRTMLQAVRILTNSGYHDLAQSLWELAFTIDKGR